VESSASRAAHRIKSSSATDNPNQSRLSIVLATAGG
jgi:hypothetical protein